jgi:Esterase-like activity of phytase
VGCACLGFALGAGSGCADESKPAVVTAAKPVSSAERVASAVPPTSWPRYTLRAEQIWQLNLPKGERFDASGLAFTAAGELLTVSDRGPSVYRIQFLPNTNAADLVELPVCFSSAQLRPFAREKIDRYDTEGIAVDDAGRIYTCEEANRWILRCDPVKGTVERLAIDWAPVRKYFDAGDLNASFEGVTVAQGRLYVANERQVGRIIVVDLESLKVIDDFTVHPSASKARDIHYSDLSWFDGLLYALLRESRCVVAINPADHRVVAEYNFKEMEREPEVLYRALYPTSQMEGLAVDRDFFWLVTDNNGTARAKYPHDIRPSLFKCRREAP